MDLFIYTFCVRTVDSAWVARFRALIVSVLVADSIESAISKAKEKGIKMQPHPVMTPPAKSTPLPLDPSKAAKLRVSLLDCCVQCRRVIVCSIHSSFFTASI